MSNSIEVKTEESKRSIHTEKIALGFAIGAFAFMVFGSILTGSRIVTALIRGFEGAFIFGILAFGLSWYLLNKLEPDSTIEEKSNAET